MKPESYPFLRIAKQYGVDYGHVLAIASRDTIAKVYFDQAWWQLRHVPNISNDIGRAMDVQQAIRNGEIDWQTGKDTCDREGTMPVFFSDGERRVPCVMECGKSGWRRVPAHMEGITFMQLIGGQWYGLRDEDLP